MDEVVETWHRELAVLSEVLKERRYKALERSPEYGPSPTLCSTTRDPDGLLVLIFIEQKSKIGIGALRCAIEDATRFGARRIILLSNEGATPFVCRELKSATRDNLAVEIFRRSELAFNVLRHRLVPKHRVLSNAERRELLERCNCRASLLPRIRTDDPVAKLLAAPVGSVVEIERTIGNVERELYYRVVVMAT
jgi:DNA-directed RNA polymerase subunit H (RpoH/RPB5)